MGRRKVSQSYWSITNLVVRIEFAFSEYSTNNPVDKITEKAVCSLSVFLTTSYCILNAELTKKHSFRLFLNIIFTYFFVPVR